MLEMELSARQRSRLRAALIAAYPRLPELELMVEDELEKDLNRITQERLQYDLTVRDLIRWTESEGRLSDLLIGASRKKLGNTQLQQFLCDGMATLVHGELCPLSEDLTQRIGHILQQYSDFGVVLDASLSVLPPDSADARCNEVAALRDERLNRVVRSYALLKLLLNDYPQGSKGPRILEFAAELLSQGDDRASALLKQWLRDADRYCVCTLSEEVSSPDPPPSQQLSLDAYLMMVVEKPPGKDRYRLKSSLQIYATQEPSRLLEEVPLDIGDDSSTKGALYTFDEIRQTYTTYINEATTQLRRSQKQLGYRRYNLTIEFFMPWHRLGEAVDLWEMTSLDGRIPTGRRYRLSLRSYDRVRQLDLLNQLELAWDKFMAILANPPAEPHPACFFEHINSLDDRVWEDLEVCLSRKFGMKMVCPPPDVAGDRDRFFKAVVQSSIPFALWTRCSRLEGCDNWATILDRFFAWEQLCTMGNLLEAVKFERETAYAAGNNAGRQLGHHLSVMWDDPNRIPTSLDPLSE